MEGAKLIDKLLAEISKLDKKKTRLRPGIYYSWYPAAHAWDYNITKNREFAIQWRGQALELAKEGHLSSRQVRVVNKLGRRLGIRTAIFTVFSVNGQDRMAVQAKRKRIIEIDKGTFEKYIKSKAY